MTQPHQIDREAVALWGCADGNGVDPRLIFRDRADALAAAAELGLTVQALYAAPEAVAWRFLYGNAPKGCWSYSTQEPDMTDTNHKSVQALALISAHPTQGGEG